jgi:hypothetical protein
MDCRPTAVGFAGFASAQKEVRGRKTGSVVPVVNNDNKLARLLAAQPLPTVKVVTTKDDADATVRGQEPNIEALPGGNGAEDRLKDKRLVNF